MSCATFVLAVFNKANAPALDLSTHEAPSAARRAADRTRQQHLADNVEVTSPVHAQHLRAHVQPAIPHAVKVVAASSAPTRPLGLSAAEALGDTLLRELIESA
jgi:hypothetical protein